MEAEHSSDNQFSGAVHRLLPAVGPVLLISLGYIDPGKWAVAVEGGARFGFDLVLPMLVFNCAAILCQYLAARIGVVTGKNLAQICGEEYNRFTCFFLGFQAELSVIVLDLTMILGIAHGLNLLFGVELFTGILLTAIDAVLFPLLRTLLVQFEAEVLFVSTAGFILLCYVFGVLSSQPEVPLVMDGMLTRLDGESAFILMSLLGANIVPHNFYLHSSIVQRRSLPNVSKSALCHSHLISIICIFGVVYLVNYAVMSSAATVFHNAGLVVLTFEDALLPMDHVPQSPTAFFALFVVLLISRQMLSITWDLGGQVILRDLFRMDPPVWLPHATVRVFAIVPALYCTWGSGAEEIYQLLIFSQVILAMLLPSSVIPLFRVASSRSIMGSLKIPPFMELLALTTFIGMLGLNIIFVAEMLFGYSDWVGNLRWNLRRSIALPYIVLLITACASLVLMLVLEVTPLRSASAGPDQQIWNWELQKTQGNPSLGGKEIDSINIECNEDPTAEELPLEKSVGSLSDNSTFEFDLSSAETLVHPDQDPHQPAIQEKHTSGPSFPTRHLEEPILETESAQVTIVDKEVSDIGSMDVCTTTPSSEPANPAQGTMVVERESQTEKDDYEGDSWEFEGLSGEVSGFGHKSTFDGPESFRSLSGISDESGNNGGSLSRLSGLGRAARRQVAAILDEFWGQLYDFHGQVAQQAKSKKPDFFLGQDQRPTAASLKVDPVGMGFSGCVTSAAERGSTLMINTNAYNSPKQLRMPNSIGSPRGIQTGLTRQSSKMLDAYMQYSTRNALDDGEKCYSSLRLPPLSEICDYQPTTVHGYQLSSYLNRMAIDSNSGFMSSQNTIATDFLPANCVGTPMYAPAPKVQNTFTSSTQNPLISRVNTLHGGRQYFAPCLSQSCDDPGCRVSTKKYHSLPDISGLAGPRSGSYLDNRSSQRGSPPGFGPSIGRATYGLSKHSDSGSGAAVSLALDELSSKLYSDALSVQLSSNSDNKSFWSSQPSEQFSGMVGKIHSAGDEGIGARSSSFITETASHTDLETKLLLSFRYCIMKLLKLNGSDWLFNLNDGGADEDLIDLVAARERSYLEAETRDTNRALNMGMRSDRMSGSALKKSNGVGVPNSVPCCGEDCIWRVDLIVSFGVWCIHRILNLSLMESRPELWGKYTYVLNRLQGILDPAFSKPRSPPPPCRCLQAKMSSSQMSDGFSPATAKTGRGKCTSASMLLDLIKLVESAVSGKKGRTGTAAGEVAFPKGKENLASVLKRYKRRLSNKAFLSHETRPMPMY